MKNRPFLACTLFFSFPFTPRDATLGIVLCTCTRTLNNKKQKQNSHVNITWSEMAKTKCTR